MQMCVHDVNMHLKQRLMDVGHRMEQSVIDSAIDEWRIRLWACVRAKRGHWAQTVTSYTRNVSTCGVDESFIIFIVQFVSVFKELFSQIQLSKISSSNLCKIHSAWKGEKMQISYDLMELPTSFCVQFFYHNVIYVNQVCFYCWLICTKLSVVVQQMYVVSLFLF